MRRVVITNNEEHWHHPTKEYRKVLEQMIDAQSLLNRKEKITSMLTSLIAQSVCRYSLLTPPRPRSLLFRSTQLHIERRVKRESQNKKKPKRLFSLTA